MRAPLRPPAAPESCASRRAIVFAGTGLVLAAIAVYANSFSGPFIFDDLLSIPQNPTIRSLPTSLVPPGGGLTVTGRPLLNLSFALNHALSGDHVWSYHALNLLIHIGAGLTLFGVIRQTLRLCSGQAPAGSVWAQTCCALGFGRSKSAPLQEATLLAFAVALLWMLHPLQTESVTYIVQRAESLMGLCYLLTLYCFIRGAERQEGLGCPSTGSASSPQAHSTGSGQAHSTGSGQAHSTGSGQAHSTGSGQAGSGHSPPDSTAGHERRPKAGVEWFALAFISCLLGMATKEVMVSAPFIVLLYDRTFLAGSFRAAWRRRGWVHLVLAATWILLAGLVLQAANRGGSAGFGVGVSFWSYAATQFQALSHYLWLSVWPHPLIIDYGVQWVASVGDVALYAAGVALLVAATAVALVRWPALGFLGATFFAILAPTCLVPVARQTLAEHRMYLALAPVIVLMVLALCAWLGRRSRFVLAAAAVGLGWLTVERNTDYRSDATIWRDTVAKRPGNAAARNNYGNILALAGQPEEALAHYAEAILIEPDNADAYYNAGNALTRLGRLPEAIARYEQALRLGPNYTDAHDHLGVALAKAGRLPDAIAHFEQALRINPALPEVHSNLGNALRAAGRTPEALVQYVEALRFDPNFAEAHVNLGRALGEADRLPEAIAHFEQALRIDPAVPGVHNDLGMVLLMAGRTQDGIAHFEQALRLNPNLAQVHLNLAMALESIGRRAEASVHYATARRLGAAVPPPGN